MLRSGFNVGGRLMRELGAAKPVWRRAITCSPILHAKKKKGAGVTMPTDASGRLAALDGALAQIEGAYGKGTVMRLGGQSHASVDVISTGSLTLDAALGVGGLPRGRVVEIYGPESSGKTTLALHTIAEAQRNGGQCCFIDVEHAIDPVYARALGVQVDDLLLSQPDAGEQALEIADTLVRSGALDVVVVDSVAALVPRAEIEGEMGDHHMALQARLMSQALRKLTASLSKSRTLLIFINQIRSKVGVLFGSPDVTSGGNALKFYSSVRLEIRRSQQIKRGDTVVGNETKVKVVKNKLAPPFRVAEFDMMYGKGISLVGEVIDLGASSNIIKKAGSWYSLPAETVAKLNALPKEDPEQWKEITEASPDVEVALAQGKDKARQWLEERPQVMRALRNLVLQAKDTFPDLVDHEDDKEDDEEE